MHEGGIRNGVLTFEKTLRRVSSCAEEDDVLPVMQSASLHGKNGVSDVLLNESVLEEQEDEQRFALLLKVRLASTIAVAISLGHFPRLCFLSSRVLKVSTQRPPASTDGLCSRRPPETMPSKPCSHALPLTSSKPLADQRAARLRLARQR